MLKTMLTPFTLLLHLLNQSTCYYRSSVVTAIVSYLILKCKFWASVLFNNTIIEISVKDREPRGIIPLENLQVREVQDARRKVIFMPNIP